MWERPTLELKVGADVRCCPRLSLFIVSRSSNQIIALLQMASVLSGSRSYSHHGVGTREPECFQLFEHSAPSGRKKRFRAFSHTRHISYLSSPNITSSHITSLHIASFHVTDPLEAPCSKRLRSSPLMASFQMSPQTA
jgi:hypothetical protein